MRTRVPLALRSTAALLLALLTGCHSWHPTTVSPPAVILEEGPPSVRVTLTNGAIMTVVDPVMRNDSIVSTEAGVGGVASRDVRLLEVRRFNALKTIGFVVVAVAVGLGWARAASGSSGGAEPGPGPLPKGPALAG